MKFNKIDLQEGEYFDRTEFTPEQIEVIKDNYEVYSETTLEHKIGLGIIWENGKLMNFDLNDGGDSLDCNFKYHPVDFFPEVTLSAVPLEAPVYQMPTGAWDEETKGWSIEVTGENEGQLRHFKLFEPEHWAWNSTDDVPYIKEHFLDEKGYVHGYIRNSTCPNLYEKIDDSGNDFTVSAYDLSHFFKEVFLVEPEHKTVGKVQPEAPVAPETSVNNKRYNYVKKGFTLASEALLAFESGVELYVTVPCELGTQYELITTKRDILSELIEEETLYIKEEVQWWETISEENPCWVEFRDGTLQKTTKGKFVNHQHCTPITIERAKELLKTTENFYD